MLYKLIFYYACCNTPKLVTSWRGASLHVIQHIYFVSQLSFKKYSSLIEQALLMSDENPCNYTSFDSLMSLILKVIDNHAQLKKFSSKQKKELTNKPWIRVVNGPKSSGPNAARTQKYKPEPGPNPKTNSNPNHARKNPKVKFGLKNLAMLPSYFDYIFVHLRQKVSLRPELSPKFLSTLGPKPARTRPEKPGPTYNSAVDYQGHLRFCLSQKKNVKIATHLW